MLRLPFISGIFQAHLGLTSAAARTYVIVAKHMSGILSLVQFNNFEQTMALIGVTHSYSSHPFLRTLASQCGM